MGQIDSCKLLVFSVFLLCTGSHAVHAQRLSGSYERINERGWTETYSFQLDGSFEYARRTFDVSVVGAGWYVASRDSLILHFEGPPGKDLGEHEIITQPTDPDFCGQRIKFRVSKDRMFGGIQVGVRFTFPDRKESFLVGGVRSASGPSARDVAPLVIRFRCDMQPTSVRVSAWGYREYSIDLDGRQNSNYEIHVQLKSDFDLTGHRMEVPPHVARYRYGIDATTGGLRLRQSHSSIILKPVDQ